MERAPAKMSRVGLRRLGIAQVEKLLNRQADLVYEQVFQEALKGKTHRVVVMDSLYSTAFQTYRALYPTSTLYDFKEALVSKIRAHLPDTTIVTSIDGDLIEFSFDWSEDAQTADSDSKPKSEEEVEGPVQRRDTC